MGFKFSIPRSSWVGKFAKYFGGALILGICIGVHLNNLKISEVPHGNPVRYFLGVHFWSRDFFEFCLKPYRFFWVLIYAPLRSSHHFTSRETSRTSSLQFFVNYDINYPLMFQTEYDSLKLHCQTLEAEHEKNNQTQVSEVKTKFLCLFMPTEMTYFLRCLTSVFVFLVGGNDNRHK